ncbi:MAG: hypothetical protein JO073_06130 [Actinobacteria bacterium]|nr:hypothetical protein [Actinomycetota bacterium]
MRLPALAVVAVTVLALTACGGSSKKSSGPTPVSSGVVTDAIAKTDKAGSEHALIAATVVAGQSTVTVHGNGDFDSRKRTGTLHATFAVGGLQSTIDEVLDGATVYATSPLFSTVLPAGKTWLKLDLATASQTLGADASALTSQDPNAALDQAKAITGLVKLGTLTLNDVLTTHYRGRIDVSKLPASTRKLLTDSSARFGPVDVWVGADGYVHRIGVTTTAKANGQKTRTVVTMTLSGYGVPVTVSAPSTAATVDASTVKIPGLGG